jgi:hypothetical protein
MKMAFRAWDVMTEDPKKMLIILKAYTPGSKLRSE